MKFFPIIPLPIMILLIILLEVFLLKQAKRNYQMILILLFLINLRPMIRLNNQENLTSNLDIIFVIDNTISMNAEDYNGSGKRLDGVKEDSKKIIEDFAGARFSLILFNNTAKLTIPYTRDTEMVKEAIEITEPVKSFFAKGTSLNTPKEELEKLLKRSAEEEKERTRIVIFMSDGEITNQQALESYKSLHKYIDGGIILGYGTTEGAHMMDNTTDSYLIDYSEYPTKEAISKLEEKNLKKIASDLEIPYAKAEEKEIKKQEKEIEKIARYEKTKSTKEGYQDCYFLFAIPLLILLIVEIKETRRTIK